MRQLTAKIIERIGGDSLGHLLDALQSVPTKPFSENGLIFSITDSAIFFAKDQKGEIIEHVCDWLLLKDNKEAKLSDQSPETIEKLAGILGGGGVNEEDFKLEYLQIALPQKSTEPEKIGYKKYYHRETGKIIEAKRGDYLTSGGVRDLYFIDTIDVKPRFMAPEWFHQEYEVLT
jgi:hypothetical protein